MPAIELTYRKGAQEFSKWLDIGIFIIKIAKDVILTPSAKIFDVQHKWRRHALDVFFQNGNTSNPTTTVAKTVRPFNSERTPTKTPFFLTFDPTYSPNFAFTLSLILWGTIIIASFIFGMTRAGREVIAPGRKYQLARSGSDIGPSSAVMNALVPYLPRTNSVRW
jgi:hypothetical protein